LPGKGRLRMVLPAGAPVAGDVPQSSKAVRRAGGGAPRRCPQIGDNLWTTAGADEGILLGRKAPRARRAAFPLRGGSTADGPLERPRKRSVRRGPCASRENGWSRLRGGDVARGWLLQPVSGRAHETRCSAGIGFGVARPGIAWTRPMRREPLPAPWAVNRRPAAFARAQPPIPGARGQPRATGTGSGGFLRSCSWIVSIARSRRTAPESARASGSPRVRATGGKARWAEVRRPL